jgi:hypothetical protein
MLWVKNLGIMLCIAGAATLTGCGTTAKFTYPADASQLLKTSATNATRDQDVSVPPFEDLRGNKNQFGTFFLYMVPLSPMGFMQYERPDAARTFNTVQEFDFDATEDLAKAAAYSLRKSGVFNDAFFTFGGRKSDSDLVLEGKILSTTYTGQVWSYGLSVFGPMLWFIGLPAGTSENDLELALALRDRDSDTVIWEDEYDLDRKIVQGLYYRFGHDTRGYAYLMQDLMNKAIRDMRQSVNQKALTSAQMADN